jgi:hypothetical protein
MHASRNFWLIGPCADVSSTSHWAWDHEAGNQPGRWSPAPVCSDAGDQEVDARRFDHLAGSWWVDGRLVKAKNLWDNCVTFNAR